MKHLEEHSGNEKVYADELWNITYIKYTFLILCLVLNEVLCLETNPCSFHVSGFKKFVKRLFLLLFCAQEARVSLLFLAATGLSPAQHWSYSKKQQWVHRKYRVLARNLLS